MHDFSIKIAIVDKKAMGINDSSTSRRRYVRLTVIPLSNPLCSIIHPSKFDTYPNSLL